MHAAKQATGRTSAASGAPSDDAVGGPGRPVTASRAARWIANAAAVGLALSLVGHVIFLIATGAIRLGGSPGSTDGPARAGGVEVAVITSAELTAAEAAALDIDAPGVESATAARDLAAPVGLEVPSGGSGAGDTGDMGAIGPGLGGAGTGSGLGFGDGAGGGGGGGAKFFGVPSRGSRFAFIVDISGSMDNDKLNALKAELRETLVNLGANTSFFVVAFNSSQRLLTDRVAWHESTVEGKRPVLAALLRLESAASTNPVQAIRTVFTQLRPRPDAVYLMTDGVFDNNLEVLKLLEKLNSSAVKVPVHTIGFGADADLPTLRRIAGESGGTFKSVGAR